MILIEGIRVVAARLAAEQTAKEWLAKAQRSAADSVSEPASIDRPLRTIEFTLESRSESLSCHYL
jgi:hypothetical protein